MGNYRKREIRYIQSQGTRRFNQRTLPKFTKGIFAAYVSHTYTKIPCAESKIITESCSKSEQKRIKCLLSGAAYQISRIQRMIDSANIKMKWNVQRSLQINVLVFRFFLYDFIMHGKRTLSRLQFYWCCWCNFCCYCYSECIISILVMACVFFLHVRTDTNTYN